MDAEFFAAKKAKNIGDAAHQRGFLTYLAVKKARQDGSIIVSTFLWTILRLNLKRQR